MSKSQLEEYISEKISSIEDCGGGIYIVRFFDGRELKAKEEDARLMVRGTSFESTWLRKEFVAPDVKRTNIVLKYRYQRDLKQGDGAQEAEPAAPPAIAEFVLALFVRGKLGEGLLGDLSEQFSSNCGKYGLRRARRIYWAQVLRSMLPIVRRWLWRAVKFGAIVEYWHRWRG